MSHEPRQSLERLLQAAASQPVADDGFSRRVLSRLPAPRSAPPAWWKPVLMLGSTALGCVLAAAFAPVGLSLGAGLEDLAAARFLTPPAVAALATAAALMFAGAVLAAVAD